MEEFYEKSLQKIKSLPKIPNEKEWNKIAKLEDFLSTESLRYISGMSFYKICKKARAN